mgnify:CR=1 FL=1
MEDDAIAKRLPVFKEICGEVPTSRRIHIFCDAPGSLVPSLKRFPSLRSLALNTNHLVAEFFDIREAEKAQAEFSAYYQVSFVPSPEKAQILLKAFDLSLLEQLPQYGEIRTILPRGNHIEVEYFDLRAAQVALNNNECLLSPRETTSFGGWSNEPSPQVALEELPRRRPLDTQERQNFVIDLEALRAGEDIRTTVMIKNIPNKYSQKMLLKTFNREFAGIYDFFYLPIDFKVTFT